MKVQDLMTSSVATVAPDAPFKVVVEQLTRRGVSGLPVVDEDGTLVGIVTEGDLLAKEAYGARRRRRRVLGLVTDVLAGRDTLQLSKAAGLTAADIMTEHVITAGPEEDVRIAARRMLETGVKRLPVVDESHRVVGIIARADLLRVFERTDEALEAAISRLVERCLFVPPEADVDVKVSDGVVTLSGFVNRQSDVRVLGAIVAAVDGVVGMTNDVTFMERDPRGVR